MRSRIACTVLVAALVSACSGMDIDHSYDHNADFSTFRTYDWIAQQPRRVGDRRIDSSALHERIRDSVDRYLGQRGFQRRSTDPDFLITHFVKLDRRVDVSPAGDAWEDPWRSPHGVHGGGVHTHQYERGTLFLDIVDPESKRLLWRGTAAAELSPRDSRSEQRREVEEAVRRLLEPFPPS